MKERFSSFTSLVSKLFDYLSDFIPISSECLRGVGGKCLTFLVAFSERFIIYAYPLFLVAMEAIVKTALNADAQYFVAPALTTTAIGTVLPLAVMTKGNARSICSKIDDENWNRLRSLEASKVVHIESGRAKVFKNICFLTILLFTIIWAITVLISTESHGALDHTFPINIYVRYIPNSNVVGLVCYFMGLMLSELKEFI